MKKLLSLIGVISFTTPVTFVAVACNTTNANTISPQDIINLAKSKMQNHIFLMKDDLGLENLPKDKTNYDHLETRAKTNIASYYTNLVASGANEWQYGTVKVDINSKDSKFITKYGDGVESKVNLKINLSYANLTSHADITVKINNNETTLQDKADQVATYLNKELKDKTLSFKTLLPDKSNVNDASTIERIQTTLKSNLTTAPKDEDAILDIEGIDVVVQAPDKDEIIYELDKNNIDSSNEITGKLENLIIKVGYSQGGSFYTNLDVTTLKVSQKITDAKTQIENIIHTTEVKEFNKEDLNGGELPEESMSLKDYDSDKNFTNKIQTAIFKSIDKIYPTSKITSSTTWDENRFEIVNADSSVFIKESNSDNPGEGSGYFIISIKFAIKGDIQSTNNNFKVSLTDRDKKN